MKENLEFYEIEDSYIEYLSKYDKKIMYSKIETRKFKRKYIGILFKIEKQYYIAPLSSYKEKHKYMHDTIDFIKLGDKSVINLNNMFPTDLNCIKKVIIEDEVDENYKQLLRNEYDLGVPKFNKVIRNAKRLYTQVVKYNMPIKSRCCNFKLLEEKCKEYKN